MAISKIKAVFQSDIKKVWETVTSLENYAWRSDLSKIEVLSKNQFIECNCSVPSQLRCKIHLKSPAAMGFCTPESYSYGLSSKCFGLS